MLQVKLCSFLFGSKDGNEEIKSRLQPNCNMKTRFEESDGGGFASGGFDGGSFYGPFSYEEPSCARCLVIAIKIGPHSLSMLFCTFHADAVPESLTGIEFQSHLTQEERLAKLEVLGPKMESLIIEFRELRQQRPVALVSTHRH